jgi:hypothetical protein
MLWFVYKGTQIRIKCHIFFLSAMHKHYHMDSNNFFIPSAVILTTGLLQGQFWPGIVKLMAFRIFLYGLCITLLDWIYICSSRLSATILSLNFCYQSIHELFMLIIMSLAF